MDPRLAAADAELKAGRDPEAIELIIAALTDDPNGPLQAYRVLLRRLWKHGRFEEGAVWGAKALELAPKDFEFLNLQGVFLRRTQRFDEAIKCLDLASRVNPKDITPLVNKGNIYNDMKNGPAAEAVFAKLARLHPRNAEYQRALGRALWNQKKYGPAALRMRQALALKKDYVDAWLDLSGLENERHNQAEAVEVLSRAVEAVPGEQRLLEGKASMLRIAGRNRDAEQFLLSLLPEHDDWAWVHHQLARSVADHDRARANVHFRRAVELQPDSINYQMLLAESLERTRVGSEGGHIDDAYQVVLKVMEKGPLDSMFTKIADEVFTRVADYENSRALALSWTWAATGPPPGATPPC